MKSVKIEGNNTFSDNQLFKVMITRPSGFLNRIYFYQNIFDDDLLSLSLFYKQNGYLEVAILERLVEFDTTQNETHIQIKIEEGELTKIEGITLFGNEVFTESQLVRKIKFQPSDPLLQQKIQNAKLSILTLYADNGYLDAEVNVDIRVNSETHLSLVDFQIQEKTQYVIGEIKVQGLEKTNKNVVSRELLFKLGDVVSYSQLLKSQRRLYLTGLFQSVFIRPQPDPNGNPNKKMIFVELKESLSGEFHVSTGYGSVDKIRGKIEVFNTNVSGTARKLGVVTKASFINRGFETSFTEPWTLGIPWRTDLNFQINFQEEPGYDVERLAGRWIFGRNFTERSRFSLAYRYENANLKKIKVTQIPEKYKTYVRSLTLASVLDTRDNMFNSTKGAYLEWSNEMAGSFLSGTNTFVRSIFRLKYFYPKSRSTVFASALEIGWMNLFGGSNEIPINERFYTGGPNSLRGIGYRLAGPVDEKNVPLGGKFKIVLNALEIRRSIYKMVGGAFFVDIGNVWSEPEYFNFKDLRTSVGLGLRVNTPLGIARLDFGVNVSPEKYESPGKIYFNMGQAF